MRDYIAVFNPTFVDRKDEIRNEAVRRARAAGHEVTNEEGVLIEKRHTRDGDTSQSFLLAFVPVEPRPEKYLRPARDDLAALAIGTGIPMARGLSRGRRAGGAQ